LAPMRRELGIRGGARLLRWSRPPPNCRAGDVSDDDSPAAERPSSADALALFLSRRECPAEAAEDGTVMVELAHALHEEQARMELELYVRVWQALHGIGVDLLDEST
jgi:hypothetical protein